MTERTPWWKAFLPKKKSGGTKEPASSFGPDFNPFAQSQEKQKDSSHVPPKPDQSVDQTVYPSSNSSSLLSNETFDDSKMESVFNENTCRRNMKVSRSGRFKEKRRPRSTLPIQEKEGDGAASAREEKR